jgi:diguanylate cyclase (GGDEF)-like protein
VTFLRRSRTADLLLADERALADAWCPRFATGGEVPRLARDLLHAVLLATDAGGADAPALVEAAHGLGTLRAQQGRDTGSLVEDVLALRAVLWSALAARPDLQGDLGLLLLAQTRLADVVDTVLRATVAAYVDETQRVLRTRATRDPLTGLLNRAAFEEALHREVAASDRDTPPALLLIDLDGFKQVNDTLGHLAGDDVLVRVSRLLEAGVRRSDVVARLGGDEFAVLMPRSRRSKGVELGRRLLRRLDDDAELRDPQAPVGFSIGVGWLASPRTGDELVAVADEAMYRAKRSGGSDVAVCAAPSHVQSA